MLTKRQLSVFALYVLWLCSFVEVQDIIWTVKCECQTSEQEELLLRT